MTDYKTSDRDVNRAIRSWLHEDRHEDASRLAGAVLDRVEATPRRRATWWPARRTLTMNKFVTIGLGAAAVIAALFVGAQLLGSPTGGTGGQPAPTATPEPTPDPTPSTAAGLPVGSSYLLLDEIPLYVTIPAPGWAMEDIALARNGKDSEPDGAFVITGWVGSDPIIPGDPCHWASTMPDDPSTTLDEIVDMLGRQATRDASEPVEVTTADGYPGKSITLHVPDEPFTDCDEGKFCTLSFGDGADCHMWYHEPGMIDELWIVDRDGEFVFTAGSHWSETPADLVDEVRAILASISFSE
jgi:hypothetical protein